MAPTLVGGLQLGLDLFEAAAFVAGAAFPSGAIARVVVVIGQPGLVEGLGRVVFAPIGLFAGGIQHLGDAAPAAERLRARATFGAAAPLRVSTLGCKPCHCDFSLQTPAVNRARYAAKYVPP